MKLIIPFPPTSMDATSGSGGANFQSDILYSPPSHPLETAAGKAIPRRCLQKMSIPVMLSSLCQAVVIVSPVQNNTVPGSLDHITPESNYKGGA